MTTPVFTLVDVGARGGIDPRWRAFADALRVVAIDADGRAEVAPDGGTPRLEVIRAVAGARAGPARFHLTRSPGCSSTLPPNRPLLDRFPEPERFDVVEVATVDALPLDDILTRHGAGDVDFIKLDTQGSELSILEGAPRALAAAVGLEVEVEFMPLYEGQPLFGEVDAFLRARGFDLFDLNRCYWRRPASAAGGRGQLVFADALYLRSSDRLLEAGDGMRVAKAVLAAAAYGYADYGRALLASEGARRVMRAEDAALASAWLDRATRRSGFRRWAGRVKGAARLSQALAHLADALQPDHWASVDGRLGNSRKR